MIAATSAIELIEVAEATQIIDIIITGVKFIQAIAYTKTKFSFNNQLDVEEQGYERPYFEGNTRKEFYYNGKQGSIGQMLQLFDEEVIEVERYCQSLFGWFPSGVLTVVTWALQGQAVRHEFVIINTTYHIGVLEISRVSEQKSKENPCIIKICFWSVSSQYWRQQRKAEILKPRWYVRSLKKCSKQQIQSLNYGRINLILNILIEIWREMSDKSWFKAFKDYDIFQKNCKSLARTLLYFSFHEINTSKVLQSMMGTFTDKPFYIPHIDLIIIEEIVWHGQKISQSRKEMLQQALQKIKQIRQM